MKPHTILLNVARPPMLNFFRTFTKLDGFSGNKDRTRSSRQETGTNCMRYDAAVGVFCTKPVHSDYLYVIIAEIKNTIYSYVYAHCKT